MKHVLHWVTYFINLLVSMVVYEAHGTWPGIACLVLLVASGFMQWTEGRLSVAHRWNYGLWRKR